MTPSCSARVGSAKLMAPFAALRDASLAVQCGEVRSLVGANGAGKSTLIKILTGAVRPSAGRIEIDGATIERGDPARMLAHGVACIYQHANLAPAMSVLDNIYLGRQPTRGWGLLDRRRQRRDAEALLKLRKIDLDLDANVRDLPAVKRKEVEIAKALALNARILLMDEPTAWLSHDEVARLHQTIRALQGQRRGDRLHLSHHRRNLRHLRHRHRAARRARRRGLRGRRDFARRQLLRKFIGERLAAEVADRSMRLRAAPPLLAAEADLPWAHAARRLRGRQLRGALRRNLLRHRPCRLKAIGVGARHLRRGRVRRRRDPRRGRLRQTEIADRHDPPRLGLRA